MLERDFQTRFSRWLKYKHSRNAVFELKLTNEPSLPFSDVKDHQVANLKAAKDGHIIYKIPDDTFAQKPFDCFALYGVEACVVVMFNVKRGTRHFYMIDVDDWILERDVRSPRKSLTEERAAAIGRKGELAD